MTGSISDPSIAVVAMVEPEIAEKIVPATTATTASRPGTRRIRRSTPWMTSSASPVWNSTSPIRMNSGIGVSEKLSTEAALFSDVRMRQAVNYAIDRRALAQRGDRFHPLPAHPTGHYLPPGMPGFRDAHVYPMTADVVKARKLARGGQRTAVLYTCDSSPCPEQAQIVKTDLAAIGLQVQIKKIPFAKYFTTLGKPGDPFDLAWDGWLPDYIDPAAMLNSLLADSSFGPTFDDPAYRRRLAAASRLSGPERYLTYGRLDLQMARDAAPLAAFDNLTDTDFFSARIGCQSYGIYGMDLAALCIRRPHPR